MKKVLAAVLMGLTLTGCNQKSENNLGDLISKESGTTAQRHIQDAVIERSKQLLIETRLPVSDIAYQLGFEYPQHFSRLFKSRTGAYPEVNWKEGKLLNSVSKKDLEDWVKKQ